MLTKENVESEFSLVESIFGNLRNYHKEVEFIGHKNSCDVYFMCEVKPTQKQIDLLNDFIENQIIKLEEIEKVILKNLNFYNSKRVDNIKNSKLFLDVISVPQNNLKYDFVVVCSKIYKTMFVFNKTISLRIEYKNGQIKTAQIKEDTTEDTTEDNN